MSSYNPPQPHPHQQQQQQPAAAPSELQRKLRGHIGARAAESGDFLEGYLAGRMRQALRGAPAWLAGDPRDEAGVVSEQLVASEAFQEGLLFGRSVALSAVRAEPSDGAAAMAERRLGGRLASDGQFRLGFMAALADAFCVDSPPQPWLLPPPPPPPQHPPQHLPQHPTSPWAAGRWVPWCPPEGPSPH